MLQACIPATPRAAQGTKHPSLQRNCPAAASTLSRTGALGRVKNERNQSEPCHPASAASKFDPPVAFYLSVEPCSSSPPPVTGFRPVAHSRFSHFPAGKQHLRPQKEEVPHNNLYHIFFFLSQTGKVTPIIKSSICSHLSQLRNRFSKLSS